jgi:hypothetical protein
VALGVNVGVAVAVGVNVAVGGNVAVALGARCAVGTAVTGGSVAICAAAVGSGVDASGWQAAATNMRRRMTNNKRMDLLTR